MNAYDFVPMALLSVGGEIKGKTKLQKTVYFLGALTDCVNDLGYRAHYYGPYSQEVADAVTRFAALGLVDQTIVGSGGVNERGFEVARYDYRLNHQGRVVAQWKAASNPSLKERLKEAAKGLASAGNPDYMQMSVAAKIFYMLGRKERATEGELVEIAQRFGWKVTEDEVSKAGEYLQKLNLVEVVD